MRAGSIHPADAAEHAARRKVRQDALLRLGQKLGGFLWGARTRRAPRVAIRRCKHIQSARLAAREAATFLRTVADMPAGTGADDVGGGVFTLLDSARLVLESHST